MKLIMDRVPHPRWLSALIQEPETAWNVEIICFDERQPQIMPVSRKKEKVSGFNTTKNNFDSH